MKARRSSGCSAGFLQRMSEVLRVLAHPQRLEIVEILESLEEAPVHAIVERLGVPQAIASQHLGRLRQAGILAAERRGKERWYSLRDRNALAIMRCLCRERPRKKKGEQP